MERMGMAYLVVMNLIGFLAMYVDKQRARSGGWRIPEKRLFAIAALGGSVGSILGMKLFHHKTRHMQFVYGMPAILVIQIVIALVVR